jgi:hypothetical protein
MINLTIIATEISNANMAKACCTRGPEIDLTAWRPINKPTTDPQAKGVAKDQFMEPYKFENRTPPNETIVKTPNEVATIDFIGKSVNFLRAGTMMKPPPTPSNPEKKPASAPDIASALAHGNVQVNFPIV